MSIFGRAMARTSRLGQDLLTALLPQDCLLCASPAGRRQLCAACSAKLPRLSAELCPVCALPSLGAGICGACQAHKPYFDATVAAFQYAFPVDRLVQALKYRHHLTLAAWFAEAMLERGPPPGRHDLLLALPLAHSRLAERGYNQALEIARPLARELGLPLATAACKRAKDGPPQASLPWAERQKNVRGVFECCQDLRGKSVIVVDDVMTTGATLNEFARTLKKHGAVRVTNWVVARALKD